MTLQRGALTRVYGGAEELPLLVTLTPTTSTSSARQAYASGESATTDAATEAAKATERFEPAVRISAASASACCRLSAGELTLRVSVSDATSDTRTTRVALLESPALFVTEKR